MASIDNKTARPYRDDQRLPSRRRTPREYRTRVNPIAGVWDEIKQILQAEPRLKAKTFFDYLLRRYPGRFEGSKRRTFECRGAQLASHPRPRKNGLLSARPSSRQVRRQRLHRRWNRHPANTKPWFLQCSRTMTTTFEDLKSGFESRFVENTSSRQPVVFQKQASSGIW